LQDDCGDLLPDLDDDPTVEGPMPVAVPMHQITSARTPSQPPSGVEDVKSFRTRHTWAISHGKTL
jgi:hypothetical protein